jgi:NADH pyrophosphatase NudC (nudix superfamily)
MIYAAAILIVVGVALYVAAPLTGGLLWRAGDAIRTELERLHHERAQAMQGLSDLEFDRQMNKLSEEDYRALRAPLEKRALESMAALAEIESRKIGKRPSRPASRLAANSGAPRPLGVRFCPQCGQPVETAHKYCFGCGEPLSSVMRTSQGAG